MGTHEDRQEGTHVGTHEDRQEGTHEGTHVGTHEGRQEGTHEGTHVGTHSYAFNHMGCIRLGQWGLLCCPCKVCTVVG